MVFLFKYPMIDVFPELQIETTSRCTLACPACSRTLFAEYLGRPYPKFDLDLNDLVDFMDCESGKKVHTLILCGDHGDSIYYPRLFDLIDAFRSSKKFQIHTNGSYQTSEFWHQLAGRLTVDDEVHFGIDGLEHNNHVYRKNSDWNSIMTGLDIMTQSPAQVIWNCIVFQYNQDHIDSIRDFAHSRGVKFRAKITSRFGDDSLRPGEQYIDFQRMYRKELDDPVDIDPKCSSKWMITSQGYLQPCCWITGPFTWYKSRPYRERNRWQLKDQNLDQVMTVMAEWKDFLIQNPDQAEMVCRMHCRRGQDDPAAFDHKIAV
jgi:MoaA/NifB/PqqE/SkfB family radical SAM enzyme